VHHPGIARHHLEDFVERPGAGTSTSPVGRTAAQRAGSWFRCLPCSGHPFLGNSRRTPQLWLTSRHWQRLWPPPSAGAPTQLQTWALPPKLWPLLGHRGRGPLERMGVGNQVPGGFFAGGHCLVFARGFSLVPVMAARVARTRTQPHPSFGSLAGACARPSHSPLLTDIVHHGGAALVFPMGPPHSCTGAWTSAALC